MQLFLKNDSKSLNGLIINKNQILNKKLQN